jgi:chemotaxis protein histidine kinase CheA
MTQNKEILPIVIENHDCRFLIEYYTPLFDSLIHIFTNIVDHGIEKKEIRAEQNKRIQGLISVKALRNLKDKTNQITITDDGSGIDIDKIKAKALEGEIIKDDFLPDEKVLELIFHPGFTTNDTVSLNSGRGIGLFQVRQEVEKLDGKIRVITRKSIGTQFLIELPII